MQAEQGYLVVAVNTDSTDYVSAASRLCQSLKNWHPTALTCLLTDVSIAAPEFDYVKQLPYGNRGGYSNDWQCWYATPFRETIKLEADMLVTGEINHWWNIFRLRDVVISTGSRDFYDNAAESRFYRRIFDENNLPDTYNAITYWRRSRTAQEFWGTVRMVFENWKDYRSLLKFAPPDPDTDLVYAITAALIGEESVTLPAGVSPRIVHMKQHIQPTHTSNWTKELVWENPDHGLLINTIRQWGVFHYHIKDWRPDEQ